MSFDIFESELFLLHLRKKKKTKQSLSAVLSVILWKRTKSIVKFGIFFVVKA